MNFLFYTMAFFFAISFGTNLFSFVYGTLAVTHNNHEQQAKFLTKQTIYLSIHLLLLLLVLLFFFTCIGLSKETASTIYTWSAIGTGIFVGYVQLLIVYSGYRYISHQ